MKKVEANSALKSYFVLSRAHQAVIAAVAFLVTGLVAPWWAMIVPAFAMGLWLKAKDKRRNPVLAIALWAAGTWILVAAFHDVSVAGRLSRRIGAVMHLPWAPLLYALTGLISGAVAAMAAEAGRLVASLIYGAEVATDPVVPPGK